MPDKMMKHNAPKRATTHPLATRTTAIEPTALNGRKIAPKVKNKAVYTQTLNNYEAIRNLVTLSSDGAVESAPTGADSKRVHIKV
jgi:copper(I)-binding protein